MCCQRFIVTFKPQAESTRTLPRDHPESCLQVRDADTRRFADFTGKRRNTRQCELEVNPKARACAVTETTFFVSDRSFRQSPSAVGRLRQFVTFGCSRSARNLPTSSFGTRERPLSQGDDFSTVIDERPFAEWASRSI